MVQPDTRHALGGAGSDVSALGLRGIGVQHRCHDRAELDQLPAAFPDGADLVVEQRGPARVGVTNYQVHDVTDGMQFVLDDVVRDIALGHEHHDDAYE